MALARALVIDPPLLMFDEPLSNLDAKLRVDMRVEIRRLQQASGATALYVTHDQEEAFSISDRVAIMDRGRIRQMDVPEVLYARPADAFVARFVGFEAMVPIRVTGREGRRAARRGGGRRGAVAARRARRRGRGRGRARGAGRAARRAAGGAGGHGRGPAARVSLRTYLGRTYHYACDGPTGPVVASGPLSRPFDAGDAVRLVPEPDQCCLLAPEAGDG